MCKKCSKDSCSGCSSTCDIADIQAAIDTLEDKIEILENATKFLNGHPIIEIDDPSDISQFNQSTGLGSGDWLGWALCDGQTHDGISTPDLRDRFIVGALGNYAVGDTGGSNDVVLTVAQLPVHNHPVTDPGHDHDVTDPGHTHTITDPGHTHTADQPAHSHGFVTDAVGDHNHQVPELTEAISDTGTGASGGASPVGTSGSSFAGGHTHTGTTDTTQPVITVDSDTTDITIGAHDSDITIDENTTGISVGDSGSDDAHENRPPYYSLIFIKKVA